jgi:hypothetical protein
MIAAFAVFGASKPECIATLEHEFDQASRFHGAITNRRILFGNWLKHTVYLSPDQVMKLAKLTDGLRRAEIAIQSRAGLSTKQRVELMRTRGIPASRYGQFAYSQKGLTLKERMEFAKKADMYWKERLANSTEYPFPRKFRIELADDLRGEEQCSLARYAGSWLPSYKRAEYGYYCTEKVAIDEVLPSLTPNDAYKLARRFGPHHLSYYRGFRSGVSYGEFSNRARVATSTTLKLTPEQRVALVLSIPKTGKLKDRPYTWSPHYYPGASYERRRAAKLLHRRRKFFELTPTQIKRLERAMR